jgi:hypothetical protein
VWTTTPVALITETSDEVIRRVRREAISSRGLGGAREPPQRLRRRLGRGPRRVPCAVLPARAIARELGQAHGRPSRCSALSTEGMSRRSSVVGRSALSLCADERLPHQPGHGRRLRVVARGQRLRGRSPILFSQVLAELLLTYDPLHGQLEAYDPAELGGHEPADTFAGDQGCGRPASYRAERRVTRSSRPRDRRQRGVGRRRGRRRSSRWHGLGMTYPVGET